MNNQTIRPAVWVQGSDSPTWHVLPAGSNPAEVEIHESRCFTRALVMSITRDTPAHACPACLAIANQDAHRGIFG